MAQKFWQGDPPIAKAQPKLTRDQEHMLEARRRAFDFVFSTTMDPFGAPAGVNRPEDPWSRDAADECVKHGRLPFDRTPVCGCFQEEGAVVVSLPAKKKTREDKRAA